VLSESTVPARTGSQVIKEERRPIAVAFFFALFLVSVFAVGYLFQNFVTDFILALLLAGLFSPLYRKILPSLGRNTWLASGAVSALIVLSILLPAIFLAVNLYEATAEVYESSQGSMSLEKLDNLIYENGFIAQEARRLSKIAGLNYNKDTVKTAIQSGVRASAFFLYDRMNTLVRDVVSFLFHFLIVLLSVFFLLVDGEKLKRYVFRLSPLPSDEEELLAQKFKAVGRAIVLGNGLVAVAQGLLGGIAMGAAGLPSAVLWGTAMSIFAFLPLVGIAAVSVPATLYLIAEDEYATAALFFGFCTLVSLVFDNVIKPKLIGSQIQMHNVLIFLSIFAGIGIFGFLGILYGPLILALFLTLAELYEQRYKKRILSIVPPGFPER
jgi:predicted PurR-regulated permease PerM